MNNIRETRRKAGLTMKQLGKMVGVSEAAISHYETGRREPDPGMLSSIATALGVSVDYILGRESDPATAPLTLHADLGDGETVAQYASPRNEAEDIRAALIAKLLRLNPDQLAMAENYVSFLEHQEAEK